MLKYAYIEDMFAIEDIYGNIIYYDVYIDRLPKINDYEYSYLSSYHSKNGKKYYDKFINGCINNSTSDIMEDLLH